MKKSKRLIVSILACLMFIAAITGCATKPSSDSTKSLGNSTVSMNSSELAELTVWHPFTSTIIQTLDDSPAWTAWEEATGVEVKWIHPPAGQTKEAFTLLINSDDLPDIFLTGDEYQGGLDKAIEDGVYLRLNDIIDKYSPNFKALRAKYPEIAKNTITDEGNIVAYPQTQIAEEAFWNGLITRKDWLDKLNLKIPETVGDIEKMLVAFKDELGVEVPFINNGFKGPFSNSSTIISTFDVTANFYNQEGTVKYGYIEPGYKEFLTKMNEWYKMGLIDADFATRDDPADKAMYTSGKGGMFFTNYGDFQTYSLAGQQIDPNFKLVAIPNPVKENGEPNHFRGKPDSTTNYAFITSKCKNIEAAARFLDYSYSDEGFLLCNYGIEGKTFNWVDGPFPDISIPFLPEGYRNYDKHPEFTQEMLNNPDNIPFYDFIQIYRVFQGVNALRNPMANDIDEDHLKAMEVWSRDSNDWMMTPELTHTADEQRIIANKLTDIETYVKESTFKFVMGKESLDKFDKYVEDVKNMGINELIKIKADALARYNNR